MKKKDIIVIVVLLVVIGVGYLVFSMMQGKKDVVEVYYKDELIEKIDISVDKTYTFKGSYGKFSLEVKNHEYHAVNVECPNHDCEKMGWISTAGNAIVCMPNRLLVTIIGGKELDAVAG